VANELSLVDDSGTAVFTFFFFFFLRSFLDVRDVRPNRSLSVGV
jgi:hypothetical protein